MAYVKLSDVLQTSTLNDKDSLIIVQDNQIKKIPAELSNKGIKEYVVESIESNNTQIDTSVNEKIQVAKEEQKEYTDSVKQNLLDKVGTDKLSTKVYSFRNHPENTQLIYSTSELNTPQSVGTIVYQDKDCTVEYGKVTSNMSGTLCIDTDPSIIWAPNGSEDYVSDKRIATEAAVKNYVDDTTSEKVWDINSNANDYTTSGIYQFAGWRKSQSDNLPITNYDEDDIDRNNIAFTLVVNTKDGYLVRNDEGNVTRNIPTMIAQTLMLGNRRGSDTKIYTRHGQIDLNTNVTTWGDWKEVMTSTYLGVIDSYTGDVLNSTTEIGLYTGAIVDLASNVADVFKLEVINNYAVTTQVSAATGSSVPNSVLQTITVLNLDGSNSTKKRIGTYNGSGYTWGEWKDTASEATIKIKRGDVVYYSNYNGKPHFGVMPFDDYKNNPTSSENTRFPIGLVADPVKRTFVFTDLINKNLFVDAAKISEYLAGYTSLDNGQETAKRLSTIDGSVLNLYFPAFYDLRYNPKLNGSCFYTEQTDAYIPSLKEWEDVYSLCVGMYDASQMDKLICLKNGVTPVKETYITTLKQFYGNTSSIGNSKELKPFGLTGDETSTANYASGCCPAFGIYTEEEENNYPEF